MTSQRRGFTLIELTVVLTVMAIVSGVGILRYAGALATYRVDLAARRLAADVEQTRREARATGTPYFFEVSAADSRYRHGPAFMRLLSANLAPTRAERPDTVFLSEAPYRVSVTAVSRTDAVKYLIFDGYGAPSQGLKIELTAGGDRVRRVSVDEISGNITQD